MPKEIITLQFGRTANFVGSHLWNFQDEIFGLDQVGKSSGQQEIDHNVLMRFSESQGYLTCSPRALVVDLSGALGGNPSKGVRTVQEAQPSTWDGPVAVHRAPPVPRTDFTAHLAEEERQASERDWSGSHPQASAGEDDEAFGRLCTSARQLQERGAVRHWADFLKARLEPRSVWQLPGIWEGAGSFRGYGSGRGALGGAEEREEVTDRIRWFAEECDQMQGFQLLVDDLSGFGSVAEQTLSQLQDDFPRCPVLAFPIRSYPPLQGEAERARRLSECLSLAELCPNASLYCPLAAPAALPHAAWPADSEYHSSALCATFLEGATLTLRLMEGRPGGTDMHSMSQTLGLCGSYVFSAAQVPCPDADPPPSEPLTRPDLPFTAQEIVSWTPHLKYYRWASKVQAEFLVMRGLQKGGFVLGHAAASSALDSALMREGHRAVRQRCVSTTGLPLPLPFPQIFEPYIQRMGRRVTSPRPPHVEVESLPVLTRMGSAPEAVGELVARQLVEFSGLSGSVRGRTLMETWGYDPSERLEIQESLHSLRLVYQEKESD